MKIIFTVFNSQGVLVDSPEIEVLGDVTTEQIAAALPSFRLGDVGHGITVRAKQFLKSTPDAALLEMVNDSLSEAGLLAAAQPEQVSDDVHMSMLAEANGAFTQDDISLNVVAMGDAQSALLQLRDDNDGLIFSLPLQRDVPNYPNVVFNALRKLLDLSTRWHMTAPTLPQDAKGTNPGVRMLTAADIQTMFGLTFPGYTIPNLDSVVDHPAPKVAEILAAYGEADSASNALTREVQLGDPNGEPAPVAEVAPSPAQALKLKPEDFNYDRDREEAARAYNVRFRGIIIDPDHDPFTGTYLPHDLVYMSGALNYLNDKLEWVKFPLAGNGGSWRIWLASVAGKRPVGGPATQEVEIPPAGKPLSIRSELAKLAQTVQPAENSNTTVAANASEAYYFTVHSAGKSDVRVVMRGGNRVAAVEQGLVTFIHRQLKATSFHVTTNTFNVQGDLVSENIIAAVRTAFQMLGLNDVTIDVEPSFLPLDAEYVGLVA